MTFVVGVVVGLGVCVWLTISALDINILYILYIYICSLVANKIQITSS